VRKDEEEETEGVLLQGGVTGTGSVQGGCVAQLSKRWSLNTTVLSSPPAKFSVYFSSPCIIFLGADQITSKLPRSFRILCDTMLTDLLPLWI